MTGFDGLLLGECCMPKLTSAKNDAAQIGWNVIQMIDDHQNGKCTNVYDIVVPFYVDYSESCGCEQMVILWSSWQSRSNNIKIVFRRIIL